jgi:uncharacterized DUF497 family protein
VYVWDPQKSEENKRKHGISFEEAKDSIFEGKNIMATGVAYDKGESRHAVIGKWREKYYAGIFTIIPQGIRIISVRRARDEEEKQAKAREL